MAIEVMKCDSCGIFENINLIDGKDSGTGDFDRFECIRCYGKDWSPCSDNHIAESVQPQLKQLYDRWERVNVITPTPFMVFTKGGFFQGKNFYSTED